MKRYVVNRAMNWAFHLRLPSRLYDWKLGWLLDTRFCRLTHVGRKTGKRYKTVLEVVGTSPDRIEVIVMSGFGRESGWYRNLHVNGEAEIDVGRRHFAARYRDLGVDEATAVIAKYEGKNRAIGSILRYVLSKLVGWRYDGSSAARRELVQQLPLIAFSPFNA